MKTIATAVGWACFGACLAVTFALAAAQEPALLARPQASLEPHRQPPDRGGEGRLGPGDHTRTVTVGPATRRYRVHVPKTYGADHPTPVIVVFHGGGGNPESMVRLTGMNAKSEEAGFIVVYPYGTGAFEDRLLTFNGGGCCGYAMEKKVDDIGFTRALLDDLARIANVDPNRVFATGLSNGGIMAYFLASELSDRIAAIAPVGGPLMMDACRPTRAVSVMHFHGTADEFAPFTGGYGKGLLGRSGVTRFHSVEHSIRNWVKANGCVAEPAHRSRHRQGGRRIEPHGVFPAPFRPSSEYRFVGQRRDH